MRPVACLIRRGPGSLVRALALLLPLATAAAAQHDTAGVVVESVTPSSFGAKAGLQPGDVILSWSCAAAPPTLPEPASGSIRSPFDLRPLEIEEAPRRAVTLRGRRGNEERVWTLAASEWGLETRPVLPASLSALYLEGKARAEAGDLATTERSWRAAADAARTTGDGRLAAWFLERLAAAFGAAGKLPEAGAAYQDALTVLEEAEPRVAAEILRRWGKTLQRLSAWEEAIERYQKALALNRSMAPKSLTTAGMLEALGIAVALKGDYAAADELFQQSLMIREELAPGSISVAYSFNQLGILARRRGDFAAAESHLARGEELLRRLAPNSDLHGQFFLNLGNVARERGDLERAESLYRQAISILEMNASFGSAEGCRGNLAGIAILRGDLATADDLLRRVLAFQEQNEPDSMARAQTLISLGQIAIDRRDLDAAKAHYRHALTLMEKLSPDGPEVALSLGSLGHVALLEGDFATARTLLQRTQEIEEKRAPGSLEFAENLTDLARLEISSGGDPSRAQELLLKAFAIQEKQAPESLETSFTLRALGEVAVRRGRLQEGLAFHRRALAIQAEIAPDSLEEARTLHLLGRAKRRAGRREEGSRDLCRAIDVLDGQRGRLGGTPEAKTAFEATLGDFYHACLEGLLDLGRPAEAFHVLERGRARSFLALLAERDLRLAELPPELAAERRRVNADYDRVQSQLAALSAGRDNAEIERLTGTLRDLRTRQEQIVARIRRESPRSATLEDPQPLDLAGARAALDPGTVLLEYAVGQERTWLFVVTAAGADGPGLDLFQIALGTKELRQEVEGFRLLLKDPSSDPAKLQSQARRLYDLLVRPAAARLAGAQRLLLSADGPLHTLPFAALRRENGYLVEWKPIHSVLSATVYAELAKSRPPRREPGQERLAAFGDPVYPQPAAGAPADPAVREAVRRGLDLRPLPYSGHEVRSIATLYPQAQVFLGREATEERVKSLGGEPRLLHFACHGLLDERFPLNSALALTLPGPAAEGRENGLLQAWEIFESVRLDAELVTLSACDTALGREMGGEGLVGLTRAFQFAGARSVLGSLWEVSDRSTARLMERFYRHLRDGKPKDEALRAAQIDHLREQGGASHPFHWAAFQLSGDWR